MKACLVGLLLVAGFGCKKPEDTSPSSSMQPAAVTPTAAPKPTSDSAKQLDPSQNVAGVVGQLEREAQNRRTVKVPAEKVFEALDKIGIATQQRHQAAAWTMNASYCSSGRGADGIVVGICEYADPAKAEAGKAEMNKRFDFGSRAVRSVNGSTVMTVVVADPVKQKDVLAKATSAFTSL